MKRLAVFIDKDALTADASATRHSTIGRFSLTQAASHGLRRLAAAGYQIVVVSQDPQFASRPDRDDAIMRLEGRLRDVLAAAGVSMTGFYCCPHDPADPAESDDIEAALRATSCSCRRPRPGLLLRAAADHGLDLGRSWMVGSVLDDVDAGYQAGCHTVLVAGLNETEWRMSPERLPDIIVDDLATAADGILTRDETVSKPTPATSLSRGAASSLTLQDVWS